MKSKKSGRPSVRELLETVLARQEVLASEVALLRERVADCVSKQQSNYRGFEGWAKEIVSRIDR